MYNGHKNYNHWNVSLWINNDEGLYRFALRCIRYSMNRTEAVESFLERVSSPCTPDGVPYTKTSVRAAFSGLEA